MPFLFCASDFVGKLPAAPAILTIFRATLDAGGLAGLGTLGRSST
jgi:hypothetical protein